MPLVEWLPSKAVLVLQFNLHSSKGPTRDGVVSSIYKPVRLKVVDAIDCVIFATAMLLMVRAAIPRFSKRGVGTAMRAVSYNMDTAALMGIPGRPHRERRRSSMGTMLAAAAGFIYALKYNADLPDGRHASWTLLGLKAFIAAVVGGIGNIRGAAVGGFLIAFIDQFSAYFGAPATRVGSARQRSDRRVGRLLSC